MELNKENWFGYEMPPTEDYVKHWHYVSQPYDERGDIDSEEVGKWLIFDKTENINKVWCLIADAVLNNMLGIAAKVKTAKRSPLDKGDGTKVICVYTRNHNNIDDVMRVREALRDLGFNKKLYYKTDDATRQGKYGNKSWKYCE